MQRTTATPTPYWTQSVNDELLCAIVEFVERRGSLRDLLPRMEDIGLGAVARSWLRGAVYEPVQSEHLHAIFGTASIRALAAKVNLSPRDMVRTMAQALPRVFARLASAEARFQHII